MIDLAERAVLSNNPKALEYLLVNKGSALEIQERINTTAIDIVRTLEELADVQQYEEEI